MDVPAYAASEAMLRFHDGLFEEHADEAMFLHEQRLARLAEPDRAWVSVQDLERRIDAHLDALSIGRKRAADICVAHAVSPAGLFVALCVLCRQHDWPRVSELLAPWEGRGLNPFRAAAVLALCIELPHEQLARQSTVPLLWREVMARRLAPPAAAVRPDLVEDGVGGDQAVAARLLRDLPMNALDEAGVEALGLLGDAAAIEPLLVSLRDVDRAAAAARALHWITGAPLFESVFVADEVDEAMLIGDELAAWRDHGRAPLRGDGQPFGDLQEQLSRDPECWRGWISRQAAQLPQRGRLRFGKPLSPGVLVALLADPGSGMRLRRAMAHELVVRYGCSAQVDTALPVVRQRRAIARAAAWVQAQGSRFVAGEWYLHGEAQ